LASVTLLMDIVAPGLIFFSRKGGNEAGQRRNSVGVGKGAMASLGREEVTLPISSLQI